MNEKIKQYSQAIYEIGKENSQLNDYLDLSLAIIDTLNHNNDLIKYLGSDTIDFSKKRSLINEIIIENEFYKNWLLILIETGKGKYIRDYLNSFIKIYNKENNIENGYVWTTEPIGIDKIKEFENIVSKKLNKKVKLENKINNEIIGGVKLEVGDNVWENTIKNKLKQLIEKGSELNE